eukprot:TRINITY_DN28121_c0_g1_i1.p1 TRINITY_DN28121_c0_g1~~TRINITY_DN28121_c0_g1_i1.p1  ORF type:complete len:914 (-),score=227.25 TRINITY_DN28121_c0_g1_i1:77-2797(-)
MDAANAFILLTTWLVGLAGAFYIGRAWTPQDSRPAMTVRVQDSDGGDGQPSQAVSTSHPKSTLSPPAQTLPGVFDVKSLEESDSRNIVIASFNLPVKIKKVDDGKWDIQWKNERDVIRNFHDVSNEKTKVKFVGYPGLSVNLADKDDLELALAEFDCFPVWIENELYDRFFNGFCKGILWPLFHYFTPSLKPGFGKKWDLLWQSYNNVNMAFAKKVSEITEDDNDTIWIHNYHLLLLPSFVRKKLQRAKIGIFVHTPFPTSDLYRCLPARSNILRALLCADLIGFQTYDYARHFFSALKRIMDLDFQTMPGGALGVIYSGRSVTIRINHVGIPVQKLRDIAKSEQCQKNVVDIKLKHDSRRIILAVDDLDPVKGTVCKIQSFGGFLERYPEWIEKSVLVNVLSSSTASSQEQDDLNRQISLEVEEIKLKYGNKVIDMIDGNSVSVEELVALYQSADVGLFSTFWDGLNVCPYEFTASQDNESPASLIISEFMGCSRSLSGAASVNPWKLEQVSEAIYSSLTMSLQERKAHHDRRFKYVMKHSFTDWYQGFLRDLDEASLQTVNLNFVQVGWGSNVRLIALRTGFQHLEDQDITPDYRGSRSRLLLLDYDGTLTAESNPELAAPTEQVLKVLRILSEDPANIVFILTGRERKVLEQWFGSIPKLGLAAEKGVFYRWPEKTEWHNDLAVKDFEWKKAAKQLMKAYTERTDGSYIEPKESALVWHYEAADPEYGKMQANELAKYLQRVLEGWQGVEVVKYDYNRILEVKPKGINKGVTAERIFKQLQKSGQSPQFILAIGDDRSDEEVFLALEDILKMPSSPAPAVSPSTRVYPLEEKKDGDLEASDAKLFSVCVGIKPSNAKFYLNDPQDVVNILTSLSVLAAKVIKRLMSPGGQPADPQFSRSFSDE